MGEETGRTRLINVATSVCTGGSNMPLAYCILDVRVLRNFLNSNNEKTLFCSVDVARQEGLEPPTYCLEGSCSILLSYWRIYGAGDGNRTRVSSLEGWCSTIELHPQILFSHRILA